MIMAFLLFAFVSTSALPQRPTALLQPGHNSTVGSDNLGLSESEFLALSAQEGTFAPCERQKKHCESWCAKNSAPWTSKWCARLALLPLLRRGTVPTTAHPLHGCLMDACALARSTWDKACAGCTPCATIDKKCDAWCKSESGKTSWNKACKASKCYRKPMPHLCPRHTTVEDGLTDHVAILALSSRRLHRVR